jgi:hypothetical protein
MNNSNQTWCRYLRDSDPGVVANWGKKYQVHVYLMDADCKEFKSLWLYLRTHDASNEAILQQVAYIIYKKMGVTNNKDVHPLGKSFDVEFVSVVGCYPARQPKDSGEPVWAGWGKGHQRFSLESNLICFGKRMPWKVIRRPKPELAPEQKSLVGISGERQIDGMTWQEISDTIMGRG